MPYRWKGLVTETEMIPGSSYFSAIPASRGKKSVKLTSTNDGLRRTDVDAEAQRATGRAFALDVCSEDLRAVDVLHWYIATR